MYGPQSLEALDRNWGVQAAGAVTHVLFKFIDFDEIAKHLHKIRTRFPGVQVRTSLFTVKVKPFYEFVNEYRQVLLN